MTDTPEERAELLRLHRATKQRADVMAYHICEGIVNQLEYMTIAHVTAFCKKFLLDQHIAAEVAAREEERKRGQEAIQELAEMYRQVSEDYCDIKYLLAAVAVQIIEEIDERIDKA